MLFCTCFQGLFCPVGCRGPPAVLNRWGVGRTVFTSVSALSKATWYPETKDSHGDRLLDVGVATSRKPPNALALLPALYLTVKKTAHEQTVYTLN